MPGIAGDIGDQPRQVAAHERLAAGQPDLVDAQRHGHAHEAGDLLEGKSSARSMNDDFFGHAIGAAQVAAIRHADAQVVVHAAEAIDELVTTIDPQCSMCSLSMIIVKIPGEPTRCCRRPSFPSSRSAPVP